MRTLWVLLTVALGAGKDAKAPTKVEASEKIELAPADVAKMRGFSDGKGHVVLAHSEDPWRAPSFYGDGKTFHQQIATGGGRSEGRWNIGFWEPRVKPSSTASGFDFKDGVLTINCDDRSTALKELPADEVKKMLAEATLLKPKWKRRVHALMRDDKGNYYLLDRADADERRDWRLFVGPRGKMKPAAMTNIVDDSEGQIFSTKSGDLRLVTSTKTETPELKWVEKGKEIRLIDVPLWPNRMMIYTQLGVYDRERLGTPCDDL